MGTIKCILAGLALSLLAGCVIREDDGGRGYGHDRGEYHEDHGRDREHMYER